MKKLILFLALLSCGGLVWLGVLRAAATKGGYSLTLQEANEHKILLISVGSEPRTLDPQEAQGVTEHHHHVDGRRISSAEYRRSNQGCSRDGRSLGT